MIATGEEEKMAVASGTNARHCHRAAPPPAPAAPASACRSRGISRLAHPRAARPCRLSESPARQASAMAEPPGPGSFWPTIQNSSRAFRVIPTAQTDGGAATGARPAASPSSPSSWAPSSESPPSSESSASSAFSSNTTGW